MRLRQPRNDSSDKNKDKNEGKKSRLLFLGDAYIGFLKRRHLRPLPHRLHALAHLQGEKVGG